MRREVLINDDDNGASYTCFQVIKYQLIVFLMQNNEIK